MNNSILEKLSSYDKSALPMHMPGHKRNTDLPGAGYLGCLCAGCDITEIDGFDELHNARGILKDAMALAAGVWGSGRAWFLVNGSTCGILAAMKAVCAPGGKVIVARNCHYSVYHGLELLRLTPHYIYPETDTQTGICKAVTAEDVIRALDACPDAQLLILTSPTYEGVISDIRGICEASHERGVAVLVDEAHGAHLGFGYGFPDGAVHAGADLVVHSLHKTLPSLTQTALLHQNGSRVEPKRVSDALTYFETSSPSYLLLSSIDGCVRLLSENGGGLFPRWRDNLLLFRSRVSGFKRLRLFTPEDAEHDPSKLVIYTGESSVSGFELMKRLRNEYYIECEAAFPDYVIAMTGLGDTEASVLRLADALTEIDLKLASGSRACFCPIVKAETRLPIYEAANASRTTVPTENAAGFICAEYIWAYPPGVPLYVPGEVIDPDFLRLISGYAEAGVSLRSTYGVLPESITVLTE